MRKLFKSTSLTKLFLTVLLCGTVMAKAPRGVISAIKGNVFKTNNGVTKKLGLGEYIYDFDEIFTEVGAQLSFKDYHDHDYHLSGAAHFTMLNKMIELKSGYLWVQAPEESKSHFYVQTINSTTAFSRGEFIVSFDPESGKTQLLSLKGTHLFKNNVNELLNSEVTPGKFSFISETYENGNPRIPTPIGKNAYTTVLSLFDEVRPIKNYKSTVEELENAPSMRTHSVGRNIASVESKDKKTGGAIVVIRKKKEDRNKRDEKLLGFYSSKIKKMKKSLVKKPKKFKPEYVKKSNVAIKVFSTVKKRRPASVKPVKSYKVYKTKRARKPASIAELNPQVKVKNDAFESSLLKEYKKQMRHSKEINSLIKDLKNFDQDYKQSY